MISSLDEVIDELLISRFEPVGIHSTEPYTTRVSTAA
jgi:hypothetical protein